MSHFSSSGLSDIQRFTPPPSPTQLVRPDSPILPLTPTHVHEPATGITDPTISHASGAERPKLRKRRSSLTVNTSPLVQLKGFYRGATIATQRQNRSRSGSVNDSSSPCPVSFPIEEVKVVGRSRSGSVGNTLRSRRIIRGAKPPPSTPLPPLPPLPAVPFSAPHLGGFDLGSGIARRRPLTSRASTLENVGQAVPISPAVLHLDTGFTLKPVVNGPEDIVMKEN